MTQDMFLTSFVKFSGLYDQLLATITTISVCTCDMHLSIFHITYHKEHDIIEWIYHGEMEMWCK